MDNEITYINSRGVSVGYGREVDTRLRGVLIKREHCEVELIYIGDCEDTPIDCLYKIEGETKGVKFRYHPSIEDKINIVNQLTPTEVVNLIKDVEQTQMSFLVRKIQVETGRVLKSIDNLDNPVPSLEIIRNLIVNIRHQTNDAIKEIFKI